MKRFYLTGLAMLATVLAFAQNNIPEVAHVNASYYQIVEPSKHQLPNSKTAVLAQDFEEETFPPTGWDTICGAESQGNQHWYRQNGGRPDNGTYYAVIQRTASSNDATTRPQDEWLISPFFTVPEGGVAKFEFHSNYYWTVTPNNNANINLKISEDGENWTTIWNEDDYYNAVEWAFSEWTEVFLDLTTYVGHDVKIAFQYVGEASCWFAIDNISVDATPAMDYALTDARVKYNPQYINYGYNGHFSIFPRREINSYSRNNFEGVVNNFGTEAVAVKLNAKVFSPSDEEIFSYDFAIDTVPAGGFDANGIYQPGIDTIVYYTENTGADSGTFSIIEESIFMMENMTENGTYRYEISLLPAEGTYENVNSRPLSYSFYTEINDGCEVIRDDNNYTEGADYEANNADWNNFFAFATKYQVWNPEDILQSIEAYISAAEDGAEFHYEILLNNNETYESVLQTDHYIVDSTTFTPGFIKLSAEDIMELQSTLTEEGAYIEVLTAVVVDNGKSVSVGVDETVQASLYENMAQNSENWYRIIGTDGTLMIRLFLCEEDNAVESFTANEIEMFPNPTTGIVNFNNVENATIEVYNMMGQIVASMENASENATIDLSTIANGNYVVRIVKDGEVSTSKLNIAR